MEVILKNLKTAIFNVMEKMYFFLPDEENTKTHIINDGHVVYVGITGNPGFLITLIYDRKLASTMAADLLGIDEEKVDTNTIQKCLQETANIVAGNFLLECKGEKNRNVTFPHTRKEDVFGGCIAINSRDIVLSFNGYSVSAVLETIDTVQ